MEERKRKEIEYYDRRARGWKEDLERIEPKILESFRFCYDFLKENCKGKKLLDYGCGTGIHSLALAKMGAKIVGIDLSEKSLELAKERAKRVRR